jgi:NAD(P) transhydrogenase
MSILAYDLVVIGSGPAGQKAAIAAAKARKRVAVIDRTSMIGGVCVHTGTIPSKAVREAIFQLTGLAVKAVYGDSYRGSDEISVADLSFRVNHIIGRETQVIRAQLRRNGVAIYEESAELLDAHKIQVQSANADTKLEANKILIACGTRPAHGAGFRSTISELWIQITFQVWDRFRKKLLSSAQASWASSMRPLWRLWAPM